MLIKLDHPLSMTDHQLFEVFLREKHLFENTLVPNHIQIHTVSVKRINVMCWPPGQVIVSLRQWKQHCCNLSLHKYDNMLDYIRCFDETHLIQMENIHRKRCYSFSLFGADEVNEAKFIFNKIKFFRKNSLLK